MPSPETDRARWLRNNMSNAEWKVWSRLRGKQLEGHKFRRQVPIGPYFVDFVCLAKRLVVEIDGGGHDSEESDIRDARKTAYLESQGFDVERISIQDVDESFDGVIEGILWRLVRPRPDADSRASGELPIPRPHPGFARPPRRAGR